MSGAILYRTPTMRGTATRGHHGSIVVQRHSRHATGGVLHGVAVRGNEFGEEVDVAALGYRGVVVAVEDSLALGRSERPLFEIFLLIGLEPIAVVGFGKAHAELIELESLTALTRGENHGAWNISELHVRELSRVGHAYLPFRSRHMGHTDSTASRFS